MTNKTVLITGGGSGIGYEIANLLKELGNTVIIAGRDAGKIKQAGNVLGVEAFVCDLNNSSDIEALVEKISTEFPNLSMLVNNSGVAHLYQLGAGADAFDKATAEFKVNYFAPVLLTEKLLPVLKQQAEAAIVNITSNVSFHPLVALPSYSDSKAALHSHTVALRHTLAKDTAIKVYEVMPSLVNTAATKDMGGENGMHPREVAEAMVKGIAAGDDEIYVGDTEVQRNAYLRDPAQAITIFNKGL